MRHLAAAGDIEVGLHAVHVARIDILEAGDAHRSELGLRAEDAVLHRLQVQQLRRPQTAEVVHGRVIHDRAARLAVGLAQEASIAGIGRAGIHAGHLQRQAVDHGHVPALVDDKHRMVRRDRIEVVLVRVAPLKGHPPRTDHPLALGGVMAILSASLACISSMVKTAGQLTST